MLTFDGLLNEKHDFVIKEFRFPGRNHPRAVLCLKSPIEVGYKLIHLHRPVAYVKSRGLPLWIYDGLRALRATDTTGLTVDDLARVVSKVGGRGHKRSFSGS